MVISAHGQTLTLDSCRSLAIRNNKELRMADKQVQAAGDERKAAHTTYFPRISATGAYMHTGREVSLLSDEQKTALGNLGTTIGTVMPQLQGMSGVLNGVGQEVSDALRTDTRNATTAAVILTQPVFTGGKIAAYNRITQYAEQMARSNRDLSLQNIIVETDEAYWRIVNLQEKKKLAESYFSLVEKLDSDVTELVKEGMATKADELSVKVKVNEARVTLIQVNNGLSISRMLLCQLCGLPMDAKIEVADKADSHPLVSLTSTAHDVQTAFTNRPELRSLQLASQIAGEQVKIARSAYLPDIVLTGGYGASNPSVFNGFERKFKGTWGAGIAVSVPLFTSGERRFRLKAARAEAEAAALKVSETREKIELQVNQNRQKVEEASERLVTAERSRDEANENLRYANAGLKEGVIPVSNVLAAQTVWLSARSECVEANIDLRLAQLYLEKATGEMKNAPAAR